MMRTTLVSWVEETARWTAMALVLAVIVPARAAETGTAGDDDFMRPTKLGLRLTPGLVRGVARNWVLELAGARLDGTREDNDIAMPDGQRAKLVDAVSQRLLDLSHRHGEQGRQFVEACIEGAVLGEAKQFTPEAAQGLAQRIKPMTPLLRDFLKGVAEDGRTVLDEKQFARLQAKLESHEGMVDRLDERAGRWERGEVKAGEQPLEQLEPPEKKEDEKIGEEEKKRREKLRNAERQTHWSMREIGPSEWARYVLMVVSFFGFDEQQRAKAEQILADYRQRAAAIMTDDWKEKLRKNRIRYHLREHLGDLNGGPWEYQVQREFKELVQPLEEMGLAFRRELIGLVTDEQREAALGKIREALAKHGMTVEPRDVEILGLSKQ